MGIADGVVSKKLKRYRCGRHASEIIAGTISYDGLVDFVGNC